MINRGIYSTMKHMKVKKIIVNICLVSVLFIAPQVFAQGATATFLSDLSFNKDTNILHGYFEEARFFEENPADSLFFPVELNLTGPTADNVPIHTLSSGEGVRVSIREFEVTIDTDYSYSDGVMSDGVDTYTGVETIAVKTDGGLLVTPATLFTSMQIEDTTSFVITGSVVDTLEDYMKISAGTATILRSQVPVLVTEPKIVAWLAANIIGETEAIVLRGLMNGNITLADLDPNGDGGFDNPTDTDNGNGGGDTTTTNDDAPGTKSAIQLTNPLAKGGVTDIPTLVKKLLEIVLKVGAPLIAVALIYSGYLFIAAQGNPEALKKAKQTFVWVVVGAGILLGAYVIAESIVGTVNAIRGQ